MDKSYPIDALYNYICHSYTAARTLPFTGDNTHWEDESRIQGRTACCERTSERTIAIAINHQVNDDLIRPVDYYTKDTGTRLTYT